MLNIIEYKDKRGSVDNCHGYCQCVPINRGTLSVFNAKQVSVQLYHRAVNPIPIQRSASLLSVYSKIEHASY